MACACKVNQEISYLAKKYGHNIPVSKRMNVSFNVKRILTALTTYMVLILAIPLFLLHILYVAIFTKNKSVSVKKIINLSKR